MTRAKKFLMLFILALLLVSCSSYAQPSPAPVMTGGLTPWFTATVTPSRTPTSENIPTATLMPTPSPTPSEYKVKANDTLIVIAFRNGLTVDELLAANPNVNVYAMPIGTKLLIPAPKAMTGTMLAPTTIPEPLEIQPPYCNAALTGGLHCFALAVNVGENDLDNVTAEFRLTDPETGEVLIRSSLLPLDILQAETSLPFYTYFGSPVPTGGEVSLQLYSASKVSSTNTNIFPLKVEDIQVEIAVDGTYAEVSGSAQSVISNPAGSRIRIAVIAYDNEGRVTGIRRYEETAVLNSGSNFSFKLMVYSTGSAISSVAVFAEAAQ